jgi:hypothetical protein
MIRMSELRALMALGLALSSCASTSGHAWLDSPVEQRAEAWAVSAPLPQAAEESRPRLSHTVTLGESYAAEPVYGNPVGPAPVQINVNTPVIINNYGGYGVGYSYGYGYGSPYGYSSGRVDAPARASRGAAPKVGADFPAPPDYGPRALR